MTTYFIHGFLENPEMWAFCTSQFPNARYLSLPGHGLRIQGFCPSTMEGIAEVLITDIDASEPFQIIGHSMGGYLLPYLLRLGLNPNRLGIFHSKIGADDEAKKMQRQRAIDLVQENKSLYVRTMITHLFSDGFKVKKYQEVERLIREANAIHADTIVACHKAMMSRTCNLDYLLEKQIPVHFFAGDKDAGIPIEQVQMETLKLSHLATLDIQTGIGHMGQWEAPYTALEWLKKYFID
jgi:pimeloyl-ACP methyl ester carboxylesterase